MTRNAFSAFVFVLLGFLGCTASFAQADEARAKKIISGSCFLCHGSTGDSTSQLYPRLAGQHHEYIAKQLEHFKSGARKSSAMRDMASKLSSEEMLALGKFFEKQSVPIEVPKDSNLAKAGYAIFHHGNPLSGLPSCASCHGAEAKGTSALPRLAGQHAGYIQTQLNQFNEREQTQENAMMHAIAAKMTASEISAVAEYISSK
jgi:cytochrome c553